MHLDFDYFLRCSDIVFSKIVDIVVSIANRALHLPRSQLPWINPYGVVCQIRSALSLRSDEEISSWYLIPASSIVAIANTSLVMPFDCVKTHMEKVNPTSTYGGAVGAIYQAGGVLGFFTGVRLRFMLYFTNALFTVNLLEKLESIVNSAKRKNA